MIDGSKSEVANFFWQGAEGKICYHMAKWDMYMTGINFFKSKTKGASQFWQGLHKRVVNIVRNGEGTLFWKDTWMGEDKDVLVADCFDGDNGWSLVFLWLLYNRKTIDHIFLLLPVGELCLELWTPRLVEDIFSINDVIKVFTCCLRTTTLIGRGTNETTFLTTSFFSNNIAAEQE
ncbi:hypothetical protein ACJX0J_007769 [Zea mays]